MPIDPEEFLAEGRAYEEQERASRQNGRNGTHAERPSDPGKWSSLFTNHPESGGSFGGRNNALTALVGFLRAKRFPYDGALEYALHWNQTHCTPPLGHWEVDERVGRAWAEWVEGDLTDAKPEDTKPLPPARALLTADDLLDMEEKGHGLRWLVPNVLVMGGLHFVSAPSEAGKSWWLLELCRCVASGEDWFGIGDIQHGPVLYVDEEMGDGKTANRLRKLGFARGIPFYYYGRQGLRLPNADDRKLIKDTADKIGARLIIFDTVTGVYPGMKENESEHVSRLRAYFGEMITNERSVVAAHHDRKGGAGDSGVSHERMAGSRDFAAMADMAYGIDKRNGVHHVGTIKNRYLADDESLSMDFVLENSEDGTRVNIVSLGEEDRMKRSQEKQTKRLRFDIAEALLAGPLLTQQVKDAVKGSPNAIIAELKSMADEGVLQVEKKPGGGNLYSLPPD